MRYTICEFYLIARINIQVYIIRARRLSKPEELHTIIRYAFNKLCVLISRNKFRTRLDLRMGNERAKMSLVDKAGNSDGHIFLAVES